MPHEINLVVLTGAVASEPRIFGSGNAVCKFSISQKMREKFAYFNITAFKEMAEDAKCLLKGDRIFLNGRLQYEQYTDKKGVEHKGIGVVANHIEVIGTPAVDHREERMEQPPPHVCDEQTPDEPSTESAAGEIFF